MLFSRRRNLMPEAQLDRELRELAMAIAYPAAPDVTARVRERLLSVAAVAPAPTSVASRLKPSWKLAGLAVAILLALIAGLAIAPGTRDALARFFGLKRVQVIFEDSQPVPSPAVPLVPTAAQPTPTIPEATATPAPVVVTTSEVEPAPTAAPVIAQTAPATATAVPTPTAIPASGPVLAGATTLEQARQRVDFPIRVAGYPDGIGQPDEVYVQELGRPDEVQVILVEPLFTLYQFRATGIFTKMVFAGTRLEEIDINGSKGFWLESASHIIEYQTGDGREVVEFRRQVVGNTLAWEAGDITYRIETALSLDEARKIAESLR